MEEAEGEQMWSILHCQDGEMLATCAEPRRIVQRDRKGAGAARSRGNGHSLGAPYTSSSRVAKRRLGPAASSSLCAKQRGRASTAQECPKSTSLRPVQNNLFPGAS